MELRCRRALRLLAVTHTASDYRCWTSFPHCSLGSLACKLVAARIVGLFMQETLILD